MPEESKQPQQQQEQQQQPSEEEIRAALEEQFKRLKVDDVLLQSVVTLINLAGRRLGLGGVDPEEKDLDQAQRAIDGVRAMVPLIRGEHAQQLEPINQALAQLQVAYAREIEAKGQSNQPSDQQQSKTDESKSGPAQSSGRLWVPGE